MRRKDRELTDRDDLVTILKKADTCRVALNSITGDGAPYIVPLSFGFVWDVGAAWPTLYFHGAREGRKLDLMRLNPAVGFELDVDHVLVTGPAACDWGMRYGSLIGTGTLAEVTDPAERLVGLNHLMAQYGFVGSVDYQPAVMAQTLVLRLTVAGMTGKRKA
jgi:nitroimidazol reductase NimA-like FMN-containing flavoprotein (pyridoxamine 5'-phosphate oxidase superfamily)